MFVGGEPIREITTGVHPEGHPQAGHIWAAEHQEPLKTVSELQ